MNILKSEGRKFPELKEADAMFSSDIAPDWADGDVCNRCRVPFSMMQRKHHCRNCGQVFCHQCSAKTSTLPHFGIEKEVRVCDGCHVKLQKPILTKKPTEEDDLPAEYLTSSLAQQAQAPPRKTEEELREEEELQLALALSQSEAESKKANPSSVYALRANTTAAVKPPSPEAMKRRSPSPVAAEEPPTDPELAKYLNRSYWEQRQATEESPASPSAPSPMPSPAPQQQNIMFVATQKNSVADDPEIDEFAKVMKSQVEIFVNRMKSNSSRGRSISNDSSVQTLFMNITSMHSKLLTYIKEMDDKRMWYEQLQDKLAQVKDSRAALDVLRQEHQEKLRRIAEEQELQRQMQMAHKLEIMRKKKQEYLQYQRQLALQRIQEQEREMQMRQEQQKAQYRMGTPGFPYGMPTGPQSHGSPIHGGQYGGQPQSFAYNPMVNSGQMPRFGMGPGMGGAPQPGMPPQAGMQQPMPGMYGPGGPMPPQQQQQQQTPQQQQQFMGNAGMNGQQPPNGGGGKFFIFHFSMRIFLSRVEITLMDI
jgi:hepatocyte growth factor-regulated tyrosine kinase substrate